MTIDNPPLDVIGTLAGVAISDVAGRNRWGVARLRVDESGNARWRGPRSSTFGTAVAVGAGGTFTLTDGEDADCWVELTVTAADLAAGEVDVILSEQSENDVSSDDVTAGEALAGDVHSYEFDFVNRDADDAKDLAVYLDVYTAQLIEISDDNATWVAPTDIDDALELTLPADGSVTLYVRRTIAAGQAASPGRRTRIRWAATDGTTEYGEVSGLYRIWNSPELRAYQAAGRMPLIASGDLLGACAALPEEFETDIGDGDHRLGLTSFNGVWEAPLGKIERLLVSFGAETERPPSAARYMWLEQVAGGVLRVHALYIASADSDRRATSWALRVYVGAGPHVTPATPDYAPAVYAPAGWARLKYDLPAQSDGTLVRVTLDMRRGTGEDAVESDSSGTLASTNTVGVASPAAPLAHGRLPGLRCEV